MIDFESVILHHDFKRLLLAVSGGLDSICLAYYFITNRERFGIEWLGIAHVHHGLREGTADRDAAFVESFAKAHNVPFFLKKLDGAALKDADGSLEENARDARYKALIEVINEINNEKLKIKNVIKQKKSSLFNFHSSFAIVTAHHAGDQSETMYMRLRRGTTLAGLRGIQEVREMNYETVANGNVYLYRPFLNVTRAELLEYAHAHNLKWCEDESNADVKFARNKIRHEYLPHLEREVPGATKQLCRIAELADKAYAKVMEKCSRSFDFAQDDNAKGDPAPEQVRGDMESGMTVKKSGMTGAAVSYIALDKKKLNRILQEHKDANLSEMLRLWLTEKGFRFPVGYFYGTKEPAHVKIPVHSVYRKRSIVKIRHTVWICEFKDALSAAKFVSCEMKEKDYNEST